MAIADAVLDICGNPEKKLAIEKRTYDYGRPMTWHNVALQHLNLFEEVIIKYSNVKSLDVYMNKAYKNYTYGSLEYV
jgi:hypothetical protein